jgi:hypothetical protein
MKPIQLAKGYQGSQSLTTPSAATPNLDPAVPKPGLLTALLAATFDQPSLYTVSFNIAAASVLPVPTGSQGAPPVPTHTPTGSASGVRCVAVCTFKVFGAQVRRVIDVGSGTSISQVAASLDVAIQDMTYTVGGPAGVSYTVTALVSDRTRPATTLPPVLWQPEPSPGAFLLAPGGSVSVPVPQDAGITSIEVNAYDDTAPDVNPIFLQVQHFTNSTLTKAYAPTLDPGYIKLTPSTNSVTIANQSVSDTVQVSLTWGVDG